MATEESAYLFVPEATKLINRRAHPGEHLAARKQ